MLLLLIIFWILSAIGCGFAAHEKGRPGYGFFWISLCFSPIVGFIAVIIASRDVQKIEEQRVKTGLMKKCPFCAEAIKKEAITCRYCGKELPAVEAITKPQEKIHWAVAFFLAIVILIIGIIIFTSNK